MTYCINPNCKTRININPIDPTKCNTCKTELLLYEGRFRIVENITRFPHNPAWEVFIVEDIKHNNTRRVLKTLSEQADPYPNLFETERKILNECKHSGIPGFVAFFPIPSHQKVPKLECPELTCIVMELIDGQDLAKWVVNSRLTEPSQVLKWLEEILNILGYLHDKKYFHRDIKPSNIMLKPNGDLVLIDFGGSRNISSTVISEGASTEVYSWFYSPPEQRTRNEFAAKPSSDFYALGQTFVHLSMGDTDTSDISLWHRRTKFGGSPIIHLINWMRAEEISARPQNVDEILQVINYLKDNRHASKIETERFIDKIKGDRNTVLIGFKKHFIEYFSQFFTTKNTMQKQPRSRQWKWLNKKNVFILLAILTLLIIRFKDPILITLFPEKIDTSYSISSIDVSSLPKQLKYMTGSSEVPMFKKLDTEIGGRGIKLIKVSEETSCRGSNTSIERLMNPQNKLDFVLSSVLAKQKELESIAIAKDRIAVVVGQSFENEIKKIQGLTIDDLVNIYTGKYTNWNQIDRGNGGKIGDIKISAYSKNPNCSGTAEVFQEQVLGNKGTIDKKLVSNDLSTHDILQSLNNGAPGSIYYMSLPEVEYQFIIPIKNEANEFLPASTDKNRPAKPNTQQYLFVLKRSLYLVYKKEDKAMGDIITKLIRSKDIQDEFQKLGFESI